MQTYLATAVEQIQNEGCALLTGVFAPDEVAVLVDGIEAALLRDDTRSTLESRGTMYAARNVVQLVPSVEKLMRRPALLEFLYRVLGPNFGLVRGLYFDKPPGRSWSLPWHKDQTIAVVDNTLPSTSFRKPTTKAGVPHVEAPRELLEQMLTLRIHLDPMTADNGPLQVIPGSHLQDALNEPAPMAIHSNAGDVFAMRPLISHASSDSLPGTALHRRILHLEFAASPILLDGFRWHTFLAATGAEGRLTMRTTQ